jgi:hypothetical protein
MFNSFNTTTRIATRRQPVPVVSLVQSLSGSLGDSVLPVWRDPARKIQIG